MKKRLMNSIVSLIILIISAMSITMFLGCEKEIEPRKVVLELVNPITGEAIQRDDVIDLPEEGTPIEVRIKDKETGRYLTDDDLPENTIEGSYHVNFIILNNEGHVYRQKYYSNWPTQKDIDDLPQYNYYEMAMFFDCRPEKPNDPKKFQRKYATRTSYVRFYINKSWRDNN